MRRIQSDDVFRKIEHPLAVFLAGHDGPQIRHGLAVLFGVGDRRKRIGTAIVLRDGNDVRPRWVARIDLHLAHI